jgi:single-strand DNA-binding protein
MTPLDEDTSDRSPLTAPSDPFVVNDVHLIGHVSKPLEIKEMPSGDFLGKWALVVKRAQRDDPVDPLDSENLASREGSTNRRRQSHDTIDCTSFDKDLIDRLSDLPPRTRLEVHGALRRRFYPGQDGRQSSYAVEAFAVAVLSTPAPVEKSTPVENAAHHGASAAPVECGAPVETGAPVESSEPAELAETVTAAG